MSVHTCRLYQLLTIALGSQKTVSYDLFKNLNQLDWDELLQLAKAQGVRFIAYEGMNSLPAEYRPASNFHLKWYMGVVQAEHRRTHYINVVEKFASQLYEGGVNKILLLKGMTISQYYDIPSRRENGDIDIFLFGENLLCDSIVRKQGIYVETIIEKDSTFNIEGIAVENHRVFFDEEMAFEREDKMYRRAQQMLYDMFEKGELRDFEVGSVTVKQLSPQSSALYHILHLFRHTTCLMLVMRHFCDWVVIFDKYRNEIDVEQLREQLIELNLDTFVGCVEQFCEEKFGYKPYLVEAKQAMQKKSQYLDEIIMLFNNEKQYIMPGAKAIKYKYMRYRAYKLYFGTTSIFESFVPEIYRNINIKLKRVVCSHE